MKDEKVEVEIFGRKLPIELEGFTQLEASAVGNMVSERMREIAEETKIVDSSKLAIYTALEFAAKLQRIEARLQDLDRVEDRKLDGMIVALQKVLEGKR